MNKKVISMICASFLFGAAGAANAEGAITLSAAQMDNVTAGVGFKSFTDVYKKLEISELITEQKLALFQAATYVTGFSAVAEAESDAEGPNADAQTFTFTEIEPPKANGFAKVNSLAKSIALMSLSSNGPTAP